MITPHFSVDELRCKCGCGLILDTPEFMTFMNRVEVMRVEYDKKIKVSSGVRCPQYNNRISSSGLDGPHTKGAIDLLVSGVDAHRLLTISMDHGFAGIGIKQSGPFGTRFIHLDDIQPSPARPRPWVWSY